MMSVAGGWFFLMACEMFTLGDRDLRLPGLGSYLQTAANAGNTRAIWWGMAVMIGVIVVMDQLVWRPVIAWAEKFKFEQVEVRGCAAIAGSGLAAQLQNLAVRLAVDGTARARIPELALCEAAHATEAPRSATRGVFQWLTRLLLAALLVGVVYESVKMVMLLTHADA